MKKLAIITTHPIQYNAPLFKMLKERANIQFKVFYTWSQSEQGKIFDPGFGKEIVWDIPLLEGYDHEFVTNVSTAPGSHHFKGIDNPTLIPEITAWHPDAVLVYGWSFRSHLKVLRYFHGKIPVLFRGDSTLLDTQKGWKWLFRKFWLKYVYSKVDIALYTGEANKQYFKAYGLKSDELKFMPHAIENERFASCETYRIKAAQLRTSMNILPGECVFLFAGKLETKKQPQMLAGAFLNVKISDAHLIIAGNGELEAELKDQYSSLKNIHFLGFQNQSQMPVLYAACDVFVLPSRGPNETWGLSINEAMAAGKPVIASDKCGASYDLIENGKTGFVIGKNDRGALEMHLQYFALNKEQVKKMGKQAAQKVSAYSYQKDCEALEETVNKI